MSRCVICDYCDDSGVGSILSSSVKHTGKNKVHEDGVCSDCKESIGEDVEYDYIHDIFYEEFDIGDDVIDETFDAFETKD